MFLPNKYERFTAALRNYLQNTMLAKGLDKKHLSRLKKIFEFESIFLSNENFPCDINHYVTRLLIAAYSKQLENNMRLNFSVEIKNNYIMNFKSFMCLVLNIIAVSNNIRIFDLPGYIAIKAETYKQLNKAVIYSIGAKMFYELKNKTVLIVVKVQPTSKKSININENFDISDPFSPINLYLT